MSSDVLDRYFHGVIQPPDGDDVPIGFGNVYDGGWAHPSRGIFGGWFPVDINLFSRFEVKTLCWHSGTRVDCASQSGSSGRVNHALDSNLA